MGKDGDAVTESSGPDRRLRLLLAARELLAERGSPADVSLHEVAARAGTTKVTLYRHFSSKDALFTEVAATLSDSGEWPGRREQIVDAALRIVPRYGLHGVTMEKIAEEAGVSPPTLYWHFKNKDDLLVAMIGRLVAHLDLGVLLPAEPVEDAEAFIRAFLPRIMRLLEEPFSMMPIILTEVAAHPDLAAVVYHQILARVWSVGSAFMEAQVQAGAFRPGPPLLRVYAVVGMALTYYLARRNFGPWIDLPAPEAAAREFAEIFLHGVIADDSGGRIHD